jgi:phosphoglycerate dehydrogenase-like enzyme
MTMTQAAFFSNAPDQIARVFGGGRRETLEAELDFYPEIVSSATFDTQLTAIRDIAFIFSTWGMPSLTEEQAGQLSGLKAVFYAAGSVQAFARPFLNKGVAVVSAWAAIAVPVAEFVTAQITLAAKGYFSAQSLCRTPEGRQGFANHYPGLLDTPVSLLGAGMVGTRVIERLKQSSVELLVFDPYLDQERAEALGVRTVSLAEAFKAGFVVSNHLADLPETKGMLTASLFESMQPYATFINTGRGATVDEAGLLRVMRKRPDLTALLDVTEPEPPGPDSLIYQTDNVLLSPHIAGSIGREVWRQADTMIEEYHRFIKGDHLRYAVTLEMLKRMA